MIKTFIKWLVYRITYIDPILLELKVIHAIYAQKIQLMENERDILKNKVVTLNKAYNETQNLIKKYQERT